MLRILDSLLREYDRRATPTNHLGKYFIYKANENIVYSDRKKYYIHIIRIFSYFIYYYLKNWRRAAA